MPTTKGSRWFAGGPPKTPDSLHVGRLRAAGAIPIGKTAAPEFGAWAYTASPLLGVTRNPWDLSVTPGGSSGGSSAAVSAGMVPVRHRQRRRRVDPQAGRLHRAGGPAAQLRPHPHLRRHAPGPERRRGLGHHHRRRHRAAARRDGRPRRPRPHLPAGAAGPLPRRRSSRLDLSGLRVGWSADLGFAVVDPEVASALRAGRPRLRGAPPAPPSSTRPVDARRLHAHLRVHGGGRQVRRRRPRPVGAPPRRARPALGARLGLPEPEAPCRGRPRWRTTAAGWCSRSRRCTRTSTSSSPRWRRSRPFAAEGPMPTEVDGQRGPRRDVGGARLPRQPGEPPGPQRAGRPHPGRPPGGAPGHRARATARTSCWPAAARYEQARPWPRHCPPITAT